MNTAEAEQMIEKHVYLLSETLKYCVECISHYTLCCDWWQTEQRVCVRLALNVPGANGFGLHVPAHKHHSDGSKQPHWLTETVTVPQWAEKLDFGKGWASLVPTERLGYWSYFCREQYANSASSLRVLWWDRGQSLKKCDRKQVSSILWALSLKGSFDIL